MRISVSISDISVLEIVTRAYGRPNGYQKGVTLFYSWWGGFVVLSECVGISGRIIDSRIHTHSVPLLILFSPTNSSLFL